MPIPPLPSFYQTTTTPRRSLINYSLTIVKQGNGGTPAMQFYFEARWVVEVDKGTTVAF